MTARQISNILTGMLSVTVISMLMVFLFITMTEAANAASNCKYFNDGREPLCWTQPDGRGQPYTRDDTGSDYRNSAAWRYHVARRRFMAAQQEGRSQWQNNGTDGGAVGTISPFVPGSVQGNAWCAERKAHGMRC